MDRLNSYGSFFLLSDCLLVMIEMSGVIFPLFLCAPAPSSLGKHWNLLNKPRSWWETHTQTQTVECKNTTPPSLVSYNYRCAWKRCVVNGCCKEAAVGSELGSIWVINYNCGSSNSRNKGVIGRKEKWWQYYVATKMAKSVWVLSMSAFCDIHFIVCLCVELKPARAWLQLATFKLQL